MNSENASESVQVSFLRGAQAPLGEIRRLRYEVIVVEQGRRWRGASDTGYIGDILDEKAYHFVVKSRGRLVSSARIHLASEGELDCQKDYEAILSAPVPDELATVSMLVWRKEFRGQGFFSLTVRSIGGFLQERGVYAVLINVRAPAVSLFRRTGFIELGRSFVHPHLEEEAIPMWLLLRSGGTDRESDLPLSSMIPREPGSPDVIKRLASILGNVQHST